jgi:hypothetical protein
MSSEPNSISMWCLSCGRGLAASKQVNNLLVVKQLIELNEVSGLHHCIPSSSWTGFSVLPWTRLQITCDWPGQHLIKQVYSSTPYKQQAAHSSPSTVLSMQCALSVDLSLCISNDRETERSNELAISKPTQTQSWELLLLHLTIHHEHLHWPAPDASMYGRTLHCIHRPARLTCRSEMRQQGRGVRPCLVPKFLAKCE